MRSGGNIKDPNSVKAAGSVPDHDADESKL